MTVSTITLEESEYIRNKTAKPLLWVGMVSIVMLFAGLTSAIVVRRAEANWMLFEFPQAFYNSTLIIIISSLTLIYAARSAKADNYTGIKTGVGLTLLLGIGFVFAQFTAYKELVDAGVFLAGAQSNPSGSFMYVLTGLHLAHLFGGIIVLIVVFVKSLLLKYNSKKILGLQLCAIYWHFLAVLWIYLFLFLMLMN
ncbi:MAG TPA: heme-copper oxidase subunit III [Flavobacteriales bacterium]|nr:heme-copper oxidase subunit III [Flavobacteriales bacterium]